MGISYNFARFLFANATAIEVRKFFEGCAMPEEHFYAVLAVIPGVPGGFNPNMPAQEQLVSFTAPGNTTGSVVER